jgi:antitoxin component YwqK of YwqJK toxin-antitoxin module
LPNGKTFTKGEFKNGSYHGLWIVNNPNGTPKQIGAYYNGRSFGRWMFFNEEGQINLVGNYVNGKAEGFWTVFFPNGDPAARVYFRLGNQLGAAWVYQQDGTVKREMRLNVIPPVIRK